MPKSRPILTILFLFMQFILFYLILTAEGAVLIWSSYSAILLCFFFAVIGFKQCNILLTAGLFFTVLADFCLVICNPIERLWGMVFFLLAQVCYASMLHQQNLHKVLLPIRIALTVAVEVLALIILKDKTDALALVSMAYYANLIMNLICALSRFKENKLLSIGFVCFLLCDTVIGLQVAAGAYLPITEGSALHQIIFMNFNLSWFFYLPSQVLIALTAKQKSSL